MAFSIQRDRRAKGGFDENKTEPGQLPWRQRAVVIATATAIGPRIQDFFTTTTWKVSGFAAGRPPPTAKKLAEEISRPIRAPTPTNAS